MRVLIAVVVTALVCAVGAGAASKLITGAQIKNGSIKAKDLAPNVRPKRGRRGKTGARGAEGARGPAGQAGPAGAAGPAKIQVVNGPVVPQGALGSDQELGTSVATCPAGSVATGGGYTAGGFKDVVSRAEPASSTEFRVVAANQSDQASSIQAYVYCAVGATAALPDAVQLRGATGSR